MIVAIHQPNFFPWHGYFGKLALCDVFVFLDSVQLSKQSYTTRVQLRYGGEARWVSAPIDKASHFQPITAARLAERPDAPWPDGFQQKLRDWYRGAPYGEEMQAWLDRLLARRTGSLAELNIDAVQAVAGALGFAPRFVRSSALGVSGASSDLLVAIVKAAGGTEYLRGAGAAAYQEDQKFEAAGVRPAALQFTQEPYPQLGDGFVPGLSILDGLFMTGFAETAARIRRGAARR